MNANEEQNNVIKNDKIDNFLKIISRLPNYEYRESQLEMAELILQSIEQDTHAIIEAGTGSGKSFAYLYPLIASL